MAREFLTVAEELLEHARCMADHLEKHGFSVAVEPKEIGYPYTPTLRAKRVPTTLLVEVAASIHEDRVVAWVGYAKSSSRDTRIALAMPEGVQRTAAESSRLRDLGVGLYLTDGTTAEEAVPPPDLALNMQLPDLASLPRKARQVLGPIYEQFDRTQWREAFADTCQSVEALSRDYLKRGMASGRITLITEKGAPRSLSAKQVDKLPLGELARAFAQIANRNYSDNKIGKVLKSINTDRIGATHHKARSSTEARLRRNCGKHMWTLVDALKELLAS